MNENEKREGDKECCTSGGCGGKRCCCGGWVIGALVLLLLGGVIGYLMGGRCSKGHMGAMGCPMAMTSPAPTR